MFTHHFVVCCKLFAGLQTPSIVIKFLTCDELDFVITEMDADHVGDKRARLLASRTRWSEIGDVTSTQPITRAVTGKMK